MPKLMIITLLAALSFGVNAESVGKITFKKGTIFVGNKDVTKLKGYLVYENDLIRTKNRSYAIIKLNDGSTLKLGSSSRIKIKTIMNKKNNSPTLINLIRGALFSKVIKGNKFKVRTRTAALGVRGTEFYSSFGKNGQDFWMCVNEGSVEVKNLLSKKKVIVNKGQGILLKNQKELTAPKNYTWTKKLNWNMDPKLGDVENTQIVDAFYQDLLDLDYE